MARNSGADTLNGEADKFVILLLDKYIAPIGLCFGIRRVLEFKKKIESYISILYFQYAERRFNCKQQ